MTVHTIDSGKQIVQDPVMNPQVDAFHHTHVIQSNVDSILLHPLELASGITRQSKCFDSVAIGPVDGVENVRTVARSAYGNQQVTRLGQIHQLLNKNLIVGKVIADRHDPANIVRKTLDSESLKLHVVE